MFYFTSNESKIYDSVIFWRFFFLHFHNIQIFGDPPVEKREHGKLTIY